MADKKLVSVIIPTFKRSARLKQAISSVLSQQNELFEIIVVDDNGLGSENQLITQKALDEFETKIRYLPHEMNKGGSAARNTGIKAAKGDFIALLDDDDEWFPQKLSIQVEYLESLDNTWGGVFCGFLMKENNNTREIVTNFQGNLAKELLQEKVEICTSTVLFRREVFQTIGFFDETFKRQQDIEFILRFFRNYKLAYANATLAIIYGHNIPKMEVFEEAKLKLLRVFKADIDNFGKIEANKTYAIQYLELTRGFIKEKRFMEAHQYFKKVLHYRVPACRKVFSLLVDVIDSLANCEIKIMLKRGQGFFDKFRKCHTVRDRIE